MAELVNIFEAYRHQNQTTIQTAYSWYHMYITVVLSCLMSHVYHYCCLFTCKGKKTISVRLLRPWIITILRLSWLYHVYYIDKDWYWQVFYRTLMIFISISIYFSMLYIVYTYIWKGVLLYRSVLRLSGTSNHSKDCIKYNSLFKLFQVASLIFILIVIQYIA